MTKSEAYDYKFAEVNLRLLRDDADPAEVSYFQDQINPLLDNAGAVRGFRGLITPEDGDWPLEDVVVGRPHAINVTVWESSAALNSFMRGNREVIRYIRAYERLYEETNMENLAFWWELLKHGIAPSVHEAIGRLQELRTNGPTNRAFNFATRADFPRPDSV